MKVTAEQVIKGIIDYADAEVMRNLPTASKWLVGTYIGMASARANGIMASVSENTMFKAMGVVDDNGMYDVDLIADCLHKSAEKYGKMSISGLGIGDLIFSADDVETLRRYIER